MSAPCPTLGFIVRTVRIAHLGELAEMLEAQGLDVRRRGTELRVTREGSQATDADRKLVFAWAERHADVRLEVGDIVDLADSP